MITLLPNREDSRDFTSGNMPDEGQEDAHEPDSYKCANLTQEADGNVHSEEPKQTEHAEMMSQPLLVEHCLCCGSSQVTHTYKHSFRFPQ